MPAILKNMRYVLLLFLLMPPAHAWTLCDSFGQCLTEEELEQEEHFRLPHEDLHILNKIEQTIHHPEEKPQITPEFPYFSE